MMANTACTAAGITYVAASNVQRKVDSYTGKVKNMIWNTEHFFEVNTSDFSFLYHLLHDDYCQLIFTVAQHRSSQV